MDPGRLRHRLTISKFSDSVASDGTVSRDTGSVSAIVRWGRVEPLTALELFEAQRQQYDATHKITMRAVKPTSTDITDATELSVTWNGSAYQVVSVLENDAINERMTMLVKQRQ